MTDYANRIALERLAGSWTFERTLSTSAAPLTGQAVCAPAPTSGAPHVLRLDYHEWGNHSAGIAFEKRYRFELQPDASSVTITHRDPHDLGGAFQTVRFREISGRDGQLHAAGENLCGHDRYVSEYQIEIDHMRITHQVAGPNKDYWIETLYHRAEAAKRG